jgi:glucose-6-phosphate isomerase
METIYQTFLVLSMIENVLKRDKVVLITEGKASSMREIAETYNFLCLDHPKDVGGRFSVFSIVGMLPAMLCGIDPLKIRAGGVEVLDNHLAEAEKGAAFVAENIRSRLFQHVSFIYSDKLATFGAWLSQLYAESTGKSGTGVTPIVARGSMDQHSQLQLYLDGTNDKCFTFFLEEQEADFQLDSKTAFPAHLAYLKNKTAMDVFRAQHDATIAALLEKKRPIRKIEIPQITPEVLGALFMYFMVEVVYICHMIGVNAFDQPAVERGKNITKALLKRYRDHKIR